MLATAMGYDRDLVESLLQARSVPDINSLLDFIAESEKTSSPVAPEEDSMCVCCGCGQ